MWSIHRLQNVSTTDLAIVMNEELRKYGSKMHLKLGLSPVTSESFAFNCRISDFPPIFFFCGFKVLGFCHLIIYFSCSFRLMIFLFYILNDVNMLEIFEDPRARNIKFWALGLNNDFKKEENGKGWKSPTETKQTITLLNQHNISFLSCDNDRLFGSITLLY